MLLAVSVAVYLAVSWTIPVAGMPVLRVSLNGPFVKLIALLFGPLWGGIAGAASDVLDFLFKPTGAYNPLLTIVAFLNGLTTGLMWMWVSRRPGKVSRVVLTSVFSCLLLFCLYALGMVVVRPGGSFALSLGLGTANTGTKVSIYVLLIFGLLMSLLALLILLFARASNPSFLTQVLRIIIAITPPSLLFTTVNTVILFWMYNTTGKAFIVMWLPRLLKEVVLIVYNAYMLVMLLTVYKKVFRKT